MRIRTRVLLALAAATCALVMAAGVAAATRIEVNNDMFRITWTPMTIGTEAGAFTRCNLTVEGSFISRSFSKVVNAHVGWVSRAIFGPGSCEQETIVFSETLPWRIRYDSFRGTLPVITGITLRLINFAFRTVGECWYVSDEMRPANNTFQIASNEVSIVSWVETAFIPKVFGGILCPASLRFQGNGTATVLNRTTKIRVRLVA